MDIEDKDFTSPSFNDGKFEWEITQKVVFPYDELPIEWKEWLYYYSLFGLYMQSEQLLMVKKNETIPKHEKITEKNKPIPKVIVKTKKMKIGPLGGIYYQTPKPERRYLTSHQKKKCVDENLKQKPKYCSEIDIESYNKRFPHKKIISP